MNLKNTLTIAAALSAGLAFGQENEEAETAESAPAKAKVQQAAVTFTTLPFCRDLEGNTGVLKPGAKDWERVEDGRFYPLGSSFRAEKGGRLVIGFGKDCLVTVADGSSFGTRAQALREQTRAIVLKSGTVLVSLPENTQTGAFQIESSGFTVKNPAGDSKYVFENTGDGYKATVRCVTGTMALEGRHFSIPQMRAANEFVMRGSNDNLETIIYGTSGDIPMKIDQGLASQIDIGDSGEQIVKTNPRQLDWRLSPETRVQINRAVPSIGEKMSVHTMAFDAAGTLQSECSFCEGRAEVNSGELVPKEATAADEAAQHAAEATTDEAAAETTDETPAEGVTEDSGSVE